VDDAKPAPPDLHDAPTGFDPVATLFQL